MTFGLWVSVNWHSHFGIFSSNVDSNDLNDYRCIFFSIYKLSSIAHSPSYFRTGVRFETFDITSQIKILLTVNFSPVIKTHTHTHKANT